MRAEIPSKVLLAGLLFGLLSCAARERLAPLRTVAHVSLERYLGTWYEIARFPQRFEKNCAGVTATYGLRKGGGIDVVNRCHRGSLNGPEKVATGRARVVDPATHAKLEVTFFWPFWGDYWIVDLDPDYRWAAVGAPSRDALWILSRTSTLPADVYQGILARLRAQGFDTSRLERTPQSPNAPGPGELGAGPREEVGRSGRHGERRRDRDQ